MWEFVDKVIYINLDEATERKARIEKELLVIPSDKIIRLSAIKGSNFIGCVKSHIKAIEMAINNKWNNVLILEDDMIWKNYEQGYMLLEQLVKSPYDVISLGNTYAQYDKDNYKLIGGQTTTAYIINKHYMEVLKDNFMDGLELLVQTGEGQKYALDVYWKQLQEKDNWRLIHPAISVQNPGYSYIEKKTVDYLHLFNGYEK